VYGLKHQKEKRSMDHFAGLDVSVKATNVCIVDDTGKIVRQGCPTDGAVNGENLCLLAGHIEQSKLIMTCVAK